LDIKWLFGVIVTTQCIPSYVTWNALCKCVSVGLYSLLIVVPAELCINPPVRNFPQFL